MSERFDPYYTWLGIPPREQPPNHYRLLSLEVFEDNADVISNAADRQMLHVRTFQTGRHAAVSQRMLNELAAARMCLLDPQEKADYDGELKQRLHAAGAETSLAPAPPPPPPSWHERKLPPPPPPVSGAVNGAAETPLASPSQLAPPPQGEPAALPRTNAPIARPQPVPVSGPAALATPSASPADAQSASPIAATGVASASPAGRPLRRRRSPSVLPLMFGLALLAAIAVAVGLGMALSGTLPHHAQKKDAAEGTATGENVPQGASLTRTDAHRAASAADNTPKRTGDANEAALKRGAPFGAKDDAADAAHVPFTVGASAGEVGSPRRTADKKPAVELELEVPEVASEETPRESMPRETATLETEFPAKSKPPAVPDKAVAKAVEKTVEPVPAVGVASPPKRQAVPAGEALGTARIRYDRVYSETIAKVKTLEEKSALAELMIRDAAETRVSPAVRYLMLDAAWQYAVEVGDYSTAKRAVDALTADYDVDALELRARLLVEAAEHARTPEAYRDIALAALDEIPPLLADHRFDEARQLAGKAQFIAVRRLKDAPLRQRANEAEAEIRRQQVLWRDVQKAREKLADAPADADANLIVGRYLCGVAGDWAGGISHLSRSAEPAWRSAALRDRSLPRTPPEQLALADAWYELAVRSPGFPGLFARAGEWYRRARSSADAGNQVRIQQRLDAILAHGLPPEIVARAAIAKEPAMESEPAVASAVGHPHARLSVSVSFRASLAGHTGVVRGLAFSPDGARLASAGDDATLRLWDVAKIAPLLTVKAHDTQAADIAFSHDGTKIATAGDLGGGRVVGVWDEKLNSLAVIDVPHKPLSHPLFLPHDESLAVAAGDSVELLDLSGKPLGTTYAHGGEILALSLSPRGTLLASGGDDGMVKVYDLVRGSMARSVRAHAAPVVALGFSSDGRKLAAATAAGSVKVFDATTAAPLAGFAAGPLTAVAFMADDNGIATAGNREVVFWDARHGHKQAALPAHEGAITAIAVSPDSRLIATGGDDKQIILWTVTVRK